MFWLKKAVSFWLMPLPSCLLLLLGGIALASSARRRKLGLRMAAAGSLLLLFYSNTLVSTLLVRPLETRYPPIPELGDGQPLPAAVAKCRYVVVLGSGSSDTAGLAATTQLYGAGLSRIVEAVRILRLLPGARLIVSGPGEPGHHTHADTLAAAAVSLGIDRTRITLIDTAKDTEDESQAVSHLVGRDRVALVTSAWHMARSARLFSVAGIDFVACPTDFASHADDVWSWTAFKFDTESLERSTKAVHEEIGLAWLRIRGRP
jgi:uncharacterized SAM-binding protein YcdF (DUF218 family)